MSSPKRRSTIWAICQPKRQRFTEGGKVELGGSVLRNACTSPAILGEVDAVIRSKKNAFILQAAPLHFVLIRTVRKR